MCCDIGGHLISVLVKGLWYGTHDVSGLSCLLYLRFPALFPLTALEFMQRPPSATSHVVCIIVVIFSPCISASLRKWAFAPPFRKCWHHKVC